MLETPNSRDTFGRNLRTLADREKSVADLCRKLGINRTQFNRYLNGASYPRPDVLNRITHHFDLDARLLTTPIEELEAEKAVEAVLSEVAPSFGHLTSGFDHERTPDGIYIAMVPKVLDSNIVNVTLIQIRTLSHGAVVVDWTLPIYLAHLVGAPVSYRSRRATGIALQHVDGISLYFSHPSTRVMRCMYFSYGFQGASHIYTGIVTSTTQSPGGKLPALPAVLQRVPRNFQSHLDARRRCSSREHKYAPDVFLQYVRSIGLT